MKKINLQYIFILMLFIASCVAPRPVIRVIPAETKTTWEQGKEFVSYQKNDFIVHCAYHGINATHLIFDVEVVNMSKEDFLLAPENFKMYTDTGKWNTVTNKIEYSSSPINAVDPELQLLKLEMQESITEANIKNSETAAIIAAVATLPILIATASVDARDTKTRVVTRTDLAATASIGVINGLEASEAGNINAINSISYNQNIWNQEAIRKTTLSPGESARGLIFFNRFDFEKYKDLKIEAPILNNDFIFFNYRIMLHYPQQQTVQ